mmetsp:Transcript_28096/g.47730  ORF Transcript_28096/g.47730 Transcript_28096/m.47730 type:complete len:241 (-) Transcript_28096:777-1499(-)
MDPLGQRGHHRQGHGGPIHHRNGGRRGGRVRPLRPQHDVQQPALHIRFPEGGQRWEREVRRRQGRQRRPHGAAGGSQTKPEMRPWNTVPTLAMSASYVAVGLGWDRGRPGVLWVCTCSALGCGGCALCRWWAWIWGFWDWSRVVCAAGGGPGGGHARLWWYVMWRLSRWHTSLLMGFRLLAVLLFGGGMGLRMAVLGRTPRYRVFRQSPGGKSKDGYLSGTPCARADILRRARGRPTGTH